MTDDRTEEALRRALRDAARQVNAPMGTLPEPVPEPSIVRRPARVPIPAAIALVLLLVAGSIAFVASRDDDTTTVASSGLATTPIMAKDADIEVFMNVDATDDQVAAVRAIAESSPDVAAFTYLSKDDSYLEFSAIFACKPDLVRSIEPADLPTSFRLRLATVDADPPIARELVARPGVEQVIVNPRETAPGTDVDSEPAPAPALSPTTTVTPSPTVVTVPPPPSATASHALPESAPSKEIPFVAPAPADCGETAGGTVVPAVPVRPPSATLPPAGEQPADPASAEQAIREMWMYTHDGSVSLDERFRDNLEEADVLLPLMKSIGRDDAVETTQILGIQFLSPTRAAVLSRNVFQGGSLDAPQVQYVVLIDGRWKWTRESQCKAIARANVHCPEGP